MMMLTGRSFNTIDFFNGRDDPSYDDDDDDRCFFFFGGTAHCFNALLALCSFS
jgi:hypothetical protein